MPTVNQGSAIRLPILYRNAANGLVDPIGPTVEIRNPSSTTVASTTPSREAQGEYFYDFNVPADAPTGQWIARFSGTIDGQLVALDVPFIVTEQGYVQGNLVSLATFRAAQGYDPTDTRDNGKIELWLPFVSQAIRSFTERDFGAPLVVEQRTFEYDGSGYLDIDDAAEISDVSYTRNGFDVILPDDEWFPQPSRRDDSPVYTYLRLPAYVGWTSGSPEMGFTYNLDMYARERFLYAIPRVVKITATWGWPIVPGDVQMAAIWTLQEWLSRPSGEGLTAEAIEGWSRAWGGKGGEATAAMAIPARARDILVNYAKVAV